jgi:hypothetical protein
MTHLVLLDNEAVQSLRDPAHRHHRRVISHVQVVAGRKRRAADIDVLVPTSVRVEAGWDRTAYTWALANRLRIRDAPLDSAAADVGAAIRRQTGVSVADAHLGAAIRSSTAERITVLTSDPGDVLRVAGERPVTVVVL